MIPPARLETDRCIVSSHHQSAALGARHLPMLALASASGPVPVDTSPLPLSQVMPSEEVARPGTTTVI